MTYIRIKGDDGAHEVLQALMSTWKPVGHVQQANPRPSILEYSDPGYSNTGYSSSILRPVYSNLDPGYLFSGSSSVYSYPDYLPNLKQLSSEYPPNPKQLPSESPPNPNQLPSESPPNPNLLSMESPPNTKHLSSDEYFRIFNVPIVESLERNPPVSPMSLPSDHGSTNVVQAPVPILKSVEVYALPSSALLGSDHGSTDMVQAPVPKPTSSTANPDPDYPLMLAPIQGSWKGQFK